jgi:protoporphyrinogen/coproporphyrinogen III oxidase
VAGDESGGAPGPRVAVVGGGVSGISTAWYLRSTGAQVELIERAETLGGRIGLDRLGDESIELGGKNIGRRYRLFREFTRECGDPAYRYFGLNTSTVRAGRVVTLDARNRLTGIWRTMSGATFSDLKLFGRLLLAVRSHDANGFLGAPYFRRLGEIHDSEPLSRHFGRAFCESILRPLLVRTNAAEPDEVYLGNLGTNLRMLLDDYDQLEAGFAPLFAEFMRHVPVRLATTALEICVDPQRVTGLRLRGPDGERVEAYDAVVLALPAPASAQLLRGLLDRAASLLLGIRYFPVATAVVSYSRDIFSPELRALRFDEGSSLSNAGAFAPARLNVVRYTFSGRAARGQLSTVTDLDELIASGEHQLARYIPVSSGERVASAARIWHEGLCAYAPRQHRLREQLQSELASIRGLFLTGDYTRGASLEACFRAGRETAAAVQGQQANARVRA